MIPFFKGARRFVDVGCLYLCKFIESVPETDNIFAVILQSTKLAVEEVSFRSLKLPPFPRLLHSMNPDFGKDIKELCDLSLPVAPASRRSRRTKQYSVVPSPVPSPSCVMCSKRGNLQVW